MSEVLNKERTKARRAAERHKSYSGISLHRTVAEDFLSKPKCVDLSKTSNALRKDTKPLGASIIRNASSKQIQNMMQNHAHKEMYLEPITMK